MRRLIEYSDEQWMVIRESAEKHAQAHSDFQSWANLMEEEFGPEIRPHLEAIWLEVKPKDARHSVASSPRGCLQNGLFFLGFYGLWFAFKDSPERFKNNDLEGALTGFIISFFCLGGSAVWDIARSKGLRQNGFQRWLPLIWPALPILSAIFMIAMDNRTRPGAVSTWKEISLADARCSVLMPGDPTRTVKRQATDAGNIDQTVYMSKTATEAYGVAFADVPPEAMKAVQGQDTRALILEQLRGFFGASLLDSHEATMDRFPAEEVTIDDQGHRATIIMRVCMVGPREYRLIYSSTIGRQNTSNALAFFGSFHVGK